ncbi:hypothetical protein L6164_028255 [Bauhinia variegata]|uniref:Uncharacterized protein n=1 Tax=Bauhinia variegata TaxID=167791 RepID=A0ACB9LWL1_BAUVA|nr:hypothetical protein L6164_028255 [Bauhinia variegata]
MGFPVGCTEMVFPKLFLHILSMLGFIKKLVSLVFRYLGLHDHDFLEPDIAWPNRVPEFQFFPAMLIREILPVVKFSELLMDLDPRDTCAVCLYEFQAHDEIRRLTNCPHIFHRSCLDRWMGYDHRTCPLCRTPIIPHDMQGPFNESLWAASGIPEFYADYSHSAAF